MAKKVSVDIANEVDLTARKGDSFYLKAVLTNEDGTVYDIIDSAEANYEANMEIYNNDQLILGFTSASGKSGPYINSTITVDGSLAELVISTTGNNMNIHPGSYKYKIYVTSSTDSETNTVVIGKLKITDL